MLYAYEDKANYFGSFVKIQSSRASIPKTEKKKKGNGMEPEILTPYNKIIGCHLFFIYFCFYGIDERVQDFTDGYSSYSAAIIQTLLQYEYYYYYQEVIILH